MGHNTMHWKPYFSIIVIPFNSHALLSWFHLIELLKVFIVFVKIQFSRSISIGCHHLLSPCISSFHGLTFHTTWPFNSFFPMWTCAPMFQALNFKVFKAFTFTFEANQCPYQHLFKLGTSHKLLFFMQTFLP
jgi:hypothetical protein